MGYELADICKDYIDKIKLTSEQYKVLFDIINCRTKNLKGHMQKCTNSDCDFTYNLYNSCSNRHCPKCLSSKQLIWKDKRINEVLPVNYRTMTFKVPSGLSELYLYNKKECYDAHFRSIQLTLNEITGGDIKIGFIQFIHTWSQLLNYHVHTHCLIPEGGISREMKWISIKNKLKNKDKIEVIFKRNLLKNLKLKMKKEIISYPGMTIDDLNKIKSTRKSIVYIDKDNISPIHAINYLGNFANKIAITNNRIVNYDGKTVTISYKDRPNGNKLEYKELDALLFLKRFCLHILPRKVSKVRYFGFMANNCKKKYLKIINTIISSRDNIDSKLEKTIKMNIRNAIALLNSPTICPKCKIGHLVNHKELLPHNSS